MLANSDRAIGELMAAELDLYAYACLSTSLVKGPAWNDEFIAAVSDRTGRPVLTAASATVEAIRAVDAARVVVVTPYPESIHVLVPGYLRHHGIETAATATLGITDGHDVGRVDPAAVAALVRATWRRDADAICAVATDLSATPIIETLEEELGVPVVTTNQALLWASLRGLGLPDRLPGLGGLLASSSSAASDRRELTVGSREPHS
jgi:maleate isomerase